MRACVRACVRERASEFFLVAPFLSLILPFVARRWRHRWIGFLYLHCSAKWMIVELDPVSAGPWQAASTREDPARGRIRRARSLRVGSAASLRLERPSERFLAETLREERKGRDVFKQSLCIQWL